MIENQERAHYASEINLNSVDIKPREFPHKRGDATQEGDNRSLDKKPRRRVDERAFVSERYKLIGGVEKWKKNVVKMQTYDG